MDCDWRSVMAHACAGRRRTARRSGTRSICGTTWPGRSAMRDFAGFTHAFLIREPERMIASYLRKREAAAFEDFGLERQAEFFEREADRLGHAPPVVDANDVLADPRACCRSCAKRSVSRGIRRCSAGRPAAATPTAPGRRTGTRRSRRAPASARPSRARSTARRRPPARRPLPALLRDGWRSTAFVAGLAVDPQPAATANGPLVRGSRFIAPAGKS